MEISSHQVEFKEIEPLRRLYREEAKCQIIHDSILSRGLADAYLILVGGRTGGYGDIWNKYNPGRVMEFFTLPTHRQLALPMFQQFLSASKAIEIEAQSNMPLMQLMLNDNGINFRPENILFEDAFTTHLPCPGGNFRVQSSESSTRSNHHHDPDSEWIIEDEGKTIAKGGILFHYNPPYGDLWMEVSEAHRRQGYGSYLVQELKRICYEIGAKPAARCNFSNTASRLTLQKAGLLPCGHLMVAEVRDILDVKR